MAKFFHLQKNKRFSFKPRYYSEIDEQRKEREERIKKEIEEQKQGKPGRVSKADMDNYLKIARRSHKKSNLRIFVILALLLLILYFFFLK